MARRAAACSGSRMWRARAPSLLPRRPRGGARSPFHRRPGREDRDRPAGDRAPWPADPERCAQAAASDSGAPPTAPWRLPARRPPAARSVRLPPDRPRQGGESGSGPMSMKRAISMAMTALLGVGAAIAVVGPVGVNADVRPGVDLLAQRGFGDPRNVYAWSMAWFRGKLYVGIARQEVCVENIIVDFYLD